jgi:two-component system response regulator
VENFDSEISILVAEDNLPEQTLLQEAFLESGIKNPVSYFQNGQDLINFLNENVVYSDVRKAHYLILLDLNMPRMNGLEALKVLKGDRRFRQIPVVILTVSSLDEDIAKSYELGANSFFKKPLNYKEFVQLTKLIKKYWLQEALLPG